MPRSFYRAGHLGNAPPCAICMGRGRGPRALLHLPHGVSVWLCAAHREPEWLRARAGRDLAVSLETVWRAANCLTARRARSLELFLAGVASAERARRLPGSYSWRALRREAEERWAAGESPRQVIDDLRRREIARPGPGHPPSVASMRRWFREGRWLGWACGTGWRRRSICTRLDSGPTNVRSRSGCALSCTRCWPQPAAPPDAPGRGMR